MIGTAVGRGLRKVPGKSLICRRYSLEPEPSPNELVDASSPFGVELRLPVVASRRFEVFFACLWMRKAASTMAASGRLRNAAELWRE